MSSEQAKITWSDIHRYWLTVCERMDSNVANRASFLEIERIGRPILTEPVDWWPKNSIEDRLNPHSKPGYFKVWEQTRAGLLHTAQLLWDAQGNIEEQHAIYILASLWNKDRPLPHAWRGKVFQFLLNLRKAIREQFPDIGGWHHRSTETLPIGIMGYTYSEKMIVPHEEIDLIYIAALEAILSTGTKKESDQLGSLEIETR